MDEGIVLRDKERSLYMNPVDKKITLDVRHSIEKTIKRYRRNPDEFIKKILDRFEDLDLEDKKTISRITR